MQQREGGGVGWGGRDEGVDGERKRRKRRRESSGSLIAQTTGVSLIPFFVGGDEEMRGRDFSSSSSSPLQGSIALSLDFSLFRQSQFHLHFGTYGAALPPTRLSPCAQRPLSQYILLGLLQDSSKIKAAVKEGCRGARNSLSGIHAADTRPRR